VSRNLADGIPPLLDAQQRGASLVAIGLFEDRLCFVEKSELERQIARELFVVLGVLFRLCRVQHVTGGGELRPQRVVDLLARASGSLPLVEQRTVRADAVRALAREGFGFVDKFLFAGANILVGGVESGEKCASTGLD